MSRSRSPRWTPAAQGVGALLRVARSRAGLSREQLAAAVGTSKGSVQAVEEDRRPPSTGLAARMSVVLDLGPWDDAVLQAAAVDPARLRSRRGVRHIRRRGTPPPPYVRARIRAERAAGASWKAIAEQLNAAGVPTAEGRSWWPSSVRKLAAQQTP
ncbi:helix-turn-helix domain-containing protein [Streptomyces longwoodensis]|uniref:helix-turn-helix domain-containing protein n=1 Tax=Streptomyces longwoodensis TaxID=68231 RepID=UPI0033CC99A9